MKSTTIIISCLLACALPFVMQGCKKAALKQQSNPNQTNFKHDYHLLVGDCPHSGLPVSLSVYQPYGGGVPSGKYSWDFGDGANSTEKTPEHTYQQPGTYNLKVIVDYDTLQQAITVALFQKSDKTHLLAGVHLFSGTMRGLIPERNYLLYSTDHIVTDTAMLITVIDSGTINMFTHTMYLKTVDTSARTVLFKDCASSTLIYWYEKDSIDYKMFWTSGNRYGEVKLHTN